VEAIATLRDELQRVDQEIARLAEAIATGGQLAPLLSALQTRQARREEIAASLAARPNEHRIDRRAIEAAVREHLTRWRTLLGAPATVAEARQLLREVLSGPMTFTPQGKSYRFEGELAIGKSSWVWRTLQLVKRALQDSNLRPPGS
jgi:hypothetical protein